MSITYWPPLTHRWYTGKDSNGDFDKDEWEKVWTGNTLLETGHFILDLFNKDRTGVSGVSGLDVENVSSRFSCVAVYAGRVWYSGSDDKRMSDKIYFSRTVRNFKDFGQLYQEADPTSEEISDLVDTDGGDITVAGARGIRKLVPYGPDLLVMATNGIWQIRGVDGVFSPTAFAVTKLSETGILSPFSFVNVEGTPFWWSHTGIYTVTRSEVSGEGQVQNITEPTIKSFWDNIGSDQKLFARGIYDGQNKRIYWLYGSADETIKFKYDRVLVLDLKTQAFLPWELKNKESGHFIMSGYYYDGNNVSITEDIEVTVEDVAVTVSGAEVTVGEVSFFDNLTLPQLKLVVKKANDRITFAEFSRSDFSDWGEKNYESYLVAGYDFLSGGATLKKNAPYVTTYFTQTETGFEANDAGDGYDVTNPSSCLMSTKWDFKSSYSTPRQVYRFKRNLVVDEAALSSFDSGYDIVATRNKVRGRGKALIIKFESEDNKDFEIIGWEVIGAVNSSL